MKNIALVGNPNSGKSTLYNALTGSTQFVGNWPGVTVEKKEGKTVINGEKVKVTDLPGIYSLSPYSNEEIISRDFILKDHPDVVINIVDASNLERNLYLTTQIVELGVPVVVALNMIDVVRKKGEELSAEALSAELGCPVCEISAINKEGLENLKAVVAQMMSNPAAPAHSFHYAKNITDALDSIKANLTENSSSNFVALKILEGDKTVVNVENIADSVWNDAKNAKEALEKSYDDDFGSIIAEQRYSWIKSIINKVILKKRKEKISLSDKIDRVLTNKWLAFPIFLLIIYGIYWVCLDLDGPNKWIVGKTFGWVFQFLFWVQGLLQSWHVVDWLVDLVCNGCIFGVGIVVAFVPYLMVLFVFLAILEECGYMARVTFIMDRLFRRFGLSGKSFIPMLLGSGCTVQAVAATRTIENENDRKMTIFLTPFIPCATMMPTIAMVAALITDSAYVPPLIYILSILFVILGGILLKKTAFKGDPTPFVMELPEYKLPRLKNIWHFVWEKTVSFFKKAATIIFITTVIVWFLKYFTFSFQHAESLDQSILAGVGQFLAPLFIPLGFGSWQLVAAMLTGYVAKDNVLPNLVGMFPAISVQMAAAQAAQDTAAVDLLNNEALTSVFATVSGNFSIASAVSFLMFFILSSPCFASIGAMRKELGSAKLTAQAVAFQMGSAYVVALISYQLLHLFGM